MIFQKGKKYLDGKGLEYTIILIVYKEQDFQILATYVEENGDIASEWFTKEGGFMHRKYTDGTSELDLINPLSRYKIGCIIRNAHITAIITSEIDGSGRCRSIVLAHSKENLWEVTVGKSSELFIRHEQNENNIENRMDIIFKAIDG